MPKQTAMSPILQKLGQRVGQAIQAHRADETEYSQFGDLPAGINGGVAQLVEAKLDLYKKGPNQGGVYFYAAGIVKIPKTHGGLPVEGLRTQIMEALCDTPQSRGRKTIDEHVAWVLNELRKLGLDTRTVSLENLETSLAALKGARPHFRFRTWQGQATAEFPDPRTQHSWNGAADYNDEDEAGGVEDDTVEAQQPAAQVQGQGPARATSGAATAPGRAQGNGRGAATATRAAGRRQATPPEPAEPEEAAGDEEFSEFDDLDSLAARADGHDEDAQGKLTGMAVDAGIDESQVDKASSWVDVVDMIRQAGPPPQNGEGAEEPAETEGETQEEASAPWQPEKEEVYMYRPLDANGKPGKKSVECEVISVNVRSKTVTLKNQADTKRVYQKVPWDKLEGS